MTGTQPNNFFQEKRSAAEIKAEILPKFLPVWGELNFSKQKESPQPALLFVDLNAGVPLREETQPATTAPAKALKSIFANSGVRLNLNAAFHTFFSDANKPAIAELEQTVQVLPFCNELGNAPVFVKEPESQLQLKEWLQKDLPALLVLDPFGHKFSQEILAQALESGGNDLLLLFEASKLKASAKIVTSGGTVQQLYGSQAAAIPLFFERNSNAKKREEFLLKCLEGGMREKGYRTLSFTFGLPGKDQPYQYLLFASKNDIACTRLKEILLEYSENQEDGVPMMAAGVKPVRLLVPEYAQYLPFSMHKLAEELLQKSTQFNRMSLEKIYEKHNVGTHYSKVNYFTAMEQLKAQGKILLLNPKTAQQVHKLSYGCLIKFVG
ncbi:MAG: three-Cys-motif partner protein TcmP [Rufibacter sp.]